MALILLLLGLMAAGALFASDLPRPWALGATPIVLAYAAWLARDEWRRPWRALTIPPAPERKTRTAEADDEPLPPVMDGIPLAALDVRWRGRVAVLHVRGHDGTSHRGVLWPDVTTAQGRRELRLAQRDRAASRSRPSMAP